MRANSIYASTTFAPDQQTYDHHFPSLKAANRKNIEIGSTHLPITNHSSLAAEIKNYQQAGFNFIVHNFFPSTQDRIILNFSSENKEIQKKTIEFYKKTIDLCHEANIEFYTIHPGFMAEALQENKTGRNFDLVFQKNNLTRKEAVQLSISGITEIADYAQAKKVKILIENHGTFHNFENCLFNCTQDFTQLFQSTPPQIFCNFNLAHAVLSEKAGAESALLLFTSLKERVKFIELSQWQGNIDAHQAFDETSELFNYLRKIMFIKPDANFIIELRNTSLEELNKSFQALENFLNQKGVAYV